MTTEVEPRAGHIWVDVETNDGLDDDIVRPDQKGKKSAIATIVSVAKDVFDYVPGDKILTWRASLVYYKEFDKHMVHQNDICGIVKIK